MTDCIRCFHFGKSIRTGKIECAIAHRCDVDPKGKCPYFVEWTR